jgi:hypothetical protein
VTKEEALKRAQELLLTSNSARALLEARTGLQLAYAYGKQWAGLASGSAKGHRINRLKTIANPDQPRIRVAMNMVEPRVTKMRSRLAPNELEFIVDAQHGAMNDQVSAMVGQRRLQLAIDEMNGLSKLREKESFRTVFGSVIIKRSIAMNGSPVTVRDEAGNPRQGEDGEPMTIKRFNHDWSVCAPFEFIRDPAATSVRFENEDCIGHEKPRTVGWLARNFGKEIKTECTMGKLLSFQKLVFEATGQKMDSSISQSQAKAVLVSEYWLRDREGPESNWPYYLLGYRDVLADGDDERALKVLHFGPNPFYGLPLHHFWYEEVPLCPWGRSIPDIVMAVQDITNLSWTAILRQLVYHSGPKWVASPDDLMHDARTSLNNRPEMPILIRSGARHIPQRIPGAQVDQAASQLVSGAPDWFDRLLNMSGVQSGEAVKRGESEKAYRYRGEMADTPIQATLKDDELEINRLLKGTLFDIVRVETPQAMIELLNKEFTPMQILALKMQDQHSSVAGVQINRDTLRPKMPREVKEETSAAVSSGMIEPVAARRSILKRHGIGMDAKEQAAFEQQTREVQSLLNQQFVEVYEGQDHEMHIWTIAFEQESGRWQSYTDIQKQFIDAHRQEHKRVMMERQMEMQGMMNPQQGEMMPPMEGQQPPGIPGAAIDAPMMPGAGPAPQLPMPSLPVQAGPMQGVM